MESQQRFGTKVAQTMHVLLFTWVERQEGGETFITIEELADKLGYIKGEHGHRPDTYASVREFVDSLNWLYLEAKLQTSNNKKALKSKSIKVEGPGFLFAFYRDKEETGRRYKDWTELSYSLGDLLEILFTKNYRKTVQDFVAKVT